MRNINITTGSVRVAVLGCFDTVANAMRCAVSPAYLRLLNLCAWQSGLRQPLTYQPATAIQRGQPFGSTFVDPLFGTPGAVNRRGLKADLLSS